MTTSRLLIEKALDFAIDKDPETLRIIIELVVEYNIAVKQALQAEDTIKRFVKDAEPFLRGQHG